MAGFVVTLILLAVCGLLFGKADTKKYLLNQVGLDLSKDRYETRKEDEFKKYALQAMKKVVDLGLYCTDENSFLDNMSEKLNQALYGREERNEWGDYDYKPPIYLGVKKHYVQHANTVIYRRIEDVRKGNAASLAKNVLFSDKKSIKRYCEILWEKYQYPWPEDWMQKDEY